MTFEEFTKQVFNDHHDCMGMSQEEIEELIDDSTHNQRERWLTKIGYDLKNDYKNM